jgi:nucleoside-diphosphate-sugar epimerase
MIFLTGGTGLVGSHILMSLLKENLAVKALRRDSSGLDSCKKVFSYYNLEQFYENINWCTGDINDVTLLEEQMAECDVVIHAAALVSFHKKDIDNLKRNNI